MGCIEIVLGLAESVLRLCLIETWDVLKCKWGVMSIEMQKGLIETWDVLKSLQLYVFWLEIVSLIETWDVLKSLLQ